MTQRHNDLITKKRKGISETPSFYLKIKQKDGSRVQNSASVWSKG